MNIDPLGALVFLLGLIALVRGPNFAFKIFVPCTLLGSAAAFSSDMFTVQPAHLLLAFLTITMVFKPEYVGGIMSAIRFPRPGFWLLCTLIYGALGALLFPRLLAGMTYVISINGRSESGIAIYPIPLAPSSTNFSQTVYFSADVLCFLLSYSYARTTGGLKNLFNAVLYYSVGNIIFAGLDLLTFWTGTSYLLSFIRNAGYTLHTDTVVLGFKRIVGSFTEASSFGGATIGIFGFSARLYLMNIRTSVTFPIALVSICLLFLSTSSTAYVAVPVLLVYLYIGAFWGAVIRERARKPMVVFLVFSPLALAILIVLILIDSNWWSSIYDLLDVLLFEKSSTQSGLERSILNEVALSNFLETYGLGTGIGGARASSFVLAAMANLGIIGSACYVLFLRKVLLPGTASDEEARTAIKSAARAACFGLLCASVVSGTLIDLGLPFFIFAGLGCSPSFASTSATVTPRLIMRGMQAVPGGNPEP